MVNREAFLRVDTGDGLKLAVEVFGKGPPLVSAHGLLSNRHVMKRQLAPLAERRRIIVYDQRGHCDSTPVIDPALYEPDRMAEDVRTVLDALGIEKAVIHGESMGAAIALLFALGSPQRVEGMLLTGPVFGDRPHPNLGFLAAQAAEVKALGVREYLKGIEQRMTQDGREAQEVVETTRCMWNSHQERSLITALSTVIHWIILKDLSAVRSLNMPACIVAWPDDPVHPLQLAEGLAAILPKARLERIPSVEQVFVRQGAVVADIFGRFLRETGKARERRQ